MKTFEEKWTAWLDGELAGKELREFEDSLGDKAAAEAEKMEARKLGALLKQELGVDVLTNADFFSHQVREAVQREETSQTEGRARSAWWTIPRLAWVGATSLAIFIACALFVMQDETSQPSESLTTVLNARVDITTNPSATLSMFEKKNDRVTVLWVEGLQSLPADYAAK
jgi:anti-sigma factor RsiW